MYNAFTYYTPTKVVFGENAEEKTGSVAASYGFKKAFLHYGTGSVIRSGLLDRVKTSLREAGIEWCELGGVVPNPHIELVREGIRIATEEGADFILAIGGGSVIDSAKAIAYGLANGGDPWDFYAFTRKPEKFFPLGVVLTLSATGAEMSDSSVLTNWELRQKHGYNSDISRPLFAIENPDLTLTMPDYQTACGCTDIFMHTMERYFTGKGNMEISDEFAEAVMRCIMESSRKLVKNPMDRDARAEVMWISSVSHNGITGCGNGGNDFVCHGLEHELSARYDVAHGAGLAAVWGSWARFVLPSIPGRFAKFAERVLGIKTEGDPAETGLKAIEAVENWFRELGMPTNIHELGIDLTDEDIEVLVSGFVVSVRGSRGSARVFRGEEARAVYEMAR